MKMSNRQWTMCLIAAIAAAIIGGAAVGQSDSKKSDSKTGDKKSAGARPFYSPPKRGAPKVRVAAASRGPDDPLPSLHVLTPDHAAHAATDSPTLFYFQSRPTDHLIEIIITAVDGIEPVFEQQVRGSKSAGYVRIDLASRDVKLKQGMAYQWSVAVVPDEDNRSKDVVTSGGVIYQPPSAELQAELKAASAADRASVYAKHGAWYDALADVMDRLSADPENTALREHLKAMLEGVGLEKAAKYDGPPPATARPAASEKPAPAPPANRSMKFKPPMRGAPARRTAAASRSADAQSIKLTALAGNSTEAATISEAPSLFYHVSKTNRMAAKLTVLREGRAEPDFEIGLSGSGRAGIHRIDLAPCGVSLEKNVRYEWKVALVQDLYTEDSKDPVAQGFITRIDSPGDLTAALRTASTAERPFVYAEHGLFYDALAAVSDLIETSSAAASWRSVRNDLLRQAGLENVSD